MWMLMPLNYRLLKLDSRMPAGASGLQAEATDIGIRRMLQQASAPACGGRSKCFLVLASGSDCTAAVSLCVERHA
jgi:hypothetical protein